MNNIITLSLIIGLIAVSCTDPNTIGLEIQPTSDNIIISSANFEGFNSATESEDASKQYSVPNISSGCKNYHDILFYLDWLPVRITSLGYMFVGHFSKALPMWLESFFDGKKPTHEILIDVAQKSEDIMVNEDDCTAEPCLLVRLAKRNALLVLAAISALTLVGIIG